MCGGNLHAQVIAACSLRESPKATRVLPEAARVQGTPAVPQAARVDPTPFRQCLPLIGPTGWLKLAAFVAAGHLG